QLALVAARQLHLARGRHGRRGRLLRQRGELSAERLVADDRRIVVDEQGAVRGNRLDDAGDSFLIDQELERANARFDLHADLLAELHGHREVTGGERSYALERDEGGDRKSTRLNSSHVSISYAVFCLKK